MYAALAEHELDLFSEAIRTLEVRYPRMILRAHPHRRHDHRPHRLAARPIGMGGIASSIGEGGGHEACPVAGVSIPSAAGQRCCPKL